MANLSIRFIKSGLGFGKKLERAAQADNVHIRFKWRDVISLARATSATVEYQELVLSVLGYSLVVGDPKRIKVQPKDELAKVLGYLEIVGLDDRDGDSEFFNSHHITPRSKK